MTLDVLRFQQQQEVEAIKRVLVKRSQVVNEKVLSQALVMPQHKFKANVGLFNEGPSLPENPLYEPPKAKKGKKKKRAKAKAKK